MPDLLTHILAAQILRESAYKRIVAAGLFLGAVFPDLTVFPIQILKVIAPFIPFPPDIFYFFESSHSFFTLLLCAYLGALLVEAPLRRSFFLSLFSGMCLHIFIDLFQTKPGSGYIIFYPFSWRVYSFQLVENDYWVIWIPCFLAALLLLAAWRYLMGKWPLLHI